MYTLSNDGDTGQPRGRRLSRPLRESRCRQWS